MGRRRSLGRPREGIRIASFECARWGSHQGTLWVAITKNGSASFRVEPSMVTCCSFMASSRDDWVRGEARLISSANTIFAKIVRNQSDCGRSESPFYSPLVKKRVDLQISLSMSEDELGCGCAILVVEPVDPYFVFSGIFDPNVVGG